MFKMFKQYAYLHLLRSQAYYLTEHNRLKNLNWREAVQLAIYKYDLGVDGLPILVPRGRAPFGQHQSRIATSGQVQHQKSAIHGLSVTLRMNQV